MAKAPTIRDRIKELRRVKAADILPNPHNWRRHPKAQQDALAGVLREIGYADALLARETDAGLMLIDGHLRASLTPDATVPVLVLDVDEHEAATILATLDPLAAMAEADRDNLDALLREVSTGEAAVQAMLAELAKDAGVIPVDDDWGAALGGLATGDRAPFQQMTFTVSDAQAERIKEALAQAKAQGPFEDMGNENSNGNALDRICEAYLE